MDRVAIQNALRLARKYGYADGGMPDDPMPALMPMAAAPSPEETVNLAQKTLSAPSRRLSTRNKKNGANAPEAKQNLKNSNFLKNAIEQALEQHLSLSEGTQKAKPKTDEDDFEPIHPAMRIPGVHIRTAEAGEPFFHGDK